VASILVVEDDEDLSSTMVEWLVFNSHDAEAALTGEEGLARMIEKAFDVVILDWQLPGMAGIDVCRAYREQGGKAPVLMLTGRRDPTEKDACMKAGASEFLPKPFRLEQLSNQIQKVLELAGTK
jgi:DNA-binding response OmpR family regulator